MIVICVKSKRCKNYTKNNSPCWEDSSKGQTIFCSLFSEIFDPLI